MAKIKEDFAAAAAAQEKNLGFFTLSTDGKRFRMWTDEGLFTADAEKHSIEEVEDLYENDGFVTNPDFTLGDDEIPIYFIKPELEKVGKGVNLDKTVSVGTYTREVYQIKLKALK